MIKRLVWEQIFFFYSNEGHMENYVFKKSKAEYALKIFHNWEKVGQVDFMEEKL